MSQRFFVAYLLQSADMGLRARLNHYLTRDVSVPLIMNNQRDFSELKIPVVFNQELVFSLDKIEGVGVFSFGLGTRAE